MCIIKNKNFKELNVKQKRLDEILIKHILSNLSDYISTGEMHIITYGDISKEIYGHRNGGRSLSVSAGYVSTFWMRNKKPPLSVILCNKESNLPGLGFDEMYNDYYAENKNKQIKSKSRKEKIEKLQKDLYEYFKENIK